MISRIDLLAGVTAAGIAAVSVYHQLWALTVLFGGVLACVFIGKVFYRFRNADYLIKRYEGVDSPVWEDKHPEVKIGAFFGTFLRLGSLIAVASVLLAFNTSIEFGDFDPEEKEVIIQGEEEVPPIHIQREEKIPEFDKVVEPKPEKPDADLIIVDDNTKLLDDEPDPDPIVQQEVIVTTKIPVEEVETGEGDPVELPAVKIEDFAEISAMYPGCEDLDRKSDERKACAENAMMNFIQSSLDYPRIAVEAGIQGTVIVSFVIDVEGNTSDIEILRDINGGCGKEVIRVLKTLPAFHPAEMSGRKVPLRMRIPVKFKLEN